MAVDPIQYIKRADLAAAAALLVMLRAFLNSPRVSRRAVVSALLLGIISYTGKNSQQAMISGAVIAVVVYILDSVLEAYVPTYRQLNGEIYATLI